MMKSKAVSYLQSMSDLVQSVDQKICERWRLTISGPLCEFPNISCTVLYKIITFKLRYYKFCIKWIPRMLTGMHKMQRMALALTLFIEYHKNGDEFPRHIVRVTGEET
jgi:hypothetical protein